MVTQFRIDIHAHLRPDDAAPSKMPTPEELLLMYEKAGIRRGILLPFISLKSKPGVLTAENARALSERYPDRFFWFTTLDLEENWSREKMMGFLESEKKAGAKGVGEITSKFRFDSPQVEMLFSCCEELDLPMLFHLAADFEDAYGVVDDAGLPQMERMLQRHPRARFVGHAVPYWSEISVLESPEDRKRRIKEKVTEGRLAEIMRQNPNLYCDLSAGSGSNAMMRDREYTVKFLNEFSDRILFGCDITSPTVTFPFQLIAFLDQLLEEDEISEELWERIFFRNAMALFGISEKDLCLEEGSDHV